VGIAERTLSAVFKKSGVKDAHAHRYRHTLATRLLEQGATFEQVADILGNSRRSSGSTTASGLRAGRTTSTGS
jgi:site-specific recombinase XerD